MSKALICAIVAGALVVVLATVGGVVALVMWARQAPNLAMSFRYSHLPQKLIHVAAPRTPPANAIAVLNFRPAGDSDSKFLAVGFARALADRLYCAPTCLTRQHSVLEMSDILVNQGVDPRSPLTNAEARSLGRTLGVRYVVIGDLQSTRGHLDIGVVVLDVSSRSVSARIKASGAMAETPAMQVELAAKIASAIGLKLTAAQQAELGKPNFSNPKVLLLYGECYASKSDADPIARRWKLVEADPGSLFAVLRLLECYSSGSLMGSEIQRNTRLASLLADASKRFPGNSHLTVLRGVLLSKEYELQKAEETLKQLTRDDPGMPRAHGALAHVARWRRNGELAVKEGEKLVALWPTSANAHAALAWDYAEAAYNARHGRYGSVPPDTQAKWRSNSEASYREAVIALKLDPTNQSAKQRLEYVK
jgi:TolB-like protein